MPAFKAGTQIFFVAAPDTELAEYLRADARSRLRFWQDYLKALSRLRSFRLRPGKR